MVGPVFRVGKPVWETPFRVRETHAGDRNPLDELAAFAFEPRDLHQGRSNHRDTVDRLSRSRHVVELPVLAVKIPFPRRVQQLQRSFDVIEISRLQLEHRSLGKADDMLLVIDLLDRETRFHPSGHNHHLRLGHGRRGGEIPRAKTEPSLALGPIHSLVREFGDSEITLVRMACAHSPVPVDPEFMEGPVLTVQQGNIGSPKGLTPEGDLVPTGRSGVPRL